MPSFNAFSMASRSTDEASALEHAGISVDVVQGRSDNIKITYTDDLELARLILASQHVL